MIVSGEEELLSSLALSQGTKTHSRQALLTPPSPEIAVGKSQRLRGSGAKDEI